MKSEKKTNPFSFYNKNIVLSKSRKLSQCSWFLMRKFMVENCTQNLGGSIKQNIVILMILPLFSSISIASKIAEITLIYHNDVQLFLLVLFQMANTVFERMVIWKYQSVRKQMYIRPKWHQSDLYYIWVGTILKNIHNDLKWRQCFFFVLWALNEIASYDIIASKSIQKWQNSVN